MLFIKISLFLPPMMLLYCSETWLFPDIADVELGFLGYYVFRLDRNNFTSSCSCNGGVLIAIKSTF